MQIGKHRKTSVSGSCFSRRLFHSTPVRLFARYLKNLGGREDPSSEQPGSQSTRGFPLLFGRMRKFKAIEV